MTEKRDWNQYYANTAGRPPRPTLLKALAVLGPGNGRLALDLGCGDGRDAIAMLTAGWTVLGIDSADAAIERLRHRADLPQGAALGLCLSHIEDTPWPDRVALVNASFSLPMVGPQHLATTWQRIRSTLLAGGVFAGQLFGNKDSFVGREGLAFVSKTQAMDMLEAWDVLHFEEEESDSTTPFGEQKHWHLFHIVARKPAND